MARKQKRPSSEHTILVVDDQEETLQSVSALLRREGHRVLTASSGADALEILQEERVHLLLVDYFMPQMTGEELIREIRRADPYVQIILQTGYSGEKPPRLMLAELDIQGYHDKADGPERLLMWVDIGIKACRMIHDLRERERVQRELVANVSHEFRTPLNVIGGYAELLVEGYYGLMPPAASQPLQRVQSAALGLGDLLENLLRYAKIEAGAECVCNEEIEVEGLLHEVDEWVSLSASQTTSRFEIDAAAAPRAFVSDRIKVLTVLRNLIGNALKFTEFGVVRLTVADSGGGLRLAVSDNGPGIPAAQLQAIFKPFRQADGSSTRRHGGVGLGLALSSRLACLLGAKLEVDSRVGAGTTFTFDLPAACLEEATSGVSADESAPATAIGWM